MKVFVDTGAWVAIIIVGDKNHLRAVQTLRHLQSLSTALITSDYVLDEVLTLVRKRSSHEKAIEIGRRILRSPAVRLNRINEDVWKRAWKIFERYEDKIWSFTDCTSFAVMDDAEISQALAFDRDFRQYGKQIIP